MLGINLSGTAAATGRSIEPGGYIIRITKAYNNTSKLRMEFEFDIDEGPLAGFYTDFADRNGWSRATFYKYYTDKAQPFFKTFVNNVEDSNGGAPGLVVEITGPDGEPQEDIDETKFVGLRLGIVFGMEEYFSKKKGRVYRREDFYNADFVTVDTIRSGVFVVPELKKLDNAPTDQPSDVVDTTAGFEQSEAEMPF